MSCRAIAAGATRGRTSSRPARPATIARAARPLEEARLRLVRPPFEPRSDVYSLFTPYLADERNEAWRTLPLPRPELGRRPAPRRASARSARGSRLRSSGILERLWTAGHDGLRRRWLAPRRPARSRQPLDWDLATDARPERDPGAVPRRGLREPLRDRGGSTWTPRPTRSRPSGRDHAYARSPPARPGRVRRLDRGGPRASRLHGQRHRLGRADEPDQARARSRRARDAGLVDPFDGLADLERRGSSARSAIRTPASARMPCAWSGQFDSPPPSTSRSKPRPSRRSRGRRPWPATSRASA